MRKEIDGLADIVQINYGQKLEEGSLFRKRSIKSRLEKSGKKVENPNMDTLKTMQSFQSAHNGRQRNEDQGRKAKNPNTGDDGNYPKLSKQWY